MNISSGNVCVFDSFAYTEMYAKSRWNSSSLLIGFKTSFEIFCHVLGSESDYPMYDQEMHLNKILIYWLISATQSGDPDITVPRWHSRVSLTFEYLS